MAEETVVKRHEVVVKTLSKNALTKEMVDWLLAHGKNLNDNIKYHDPLLVQCVKEVQPDGFRVVEIEGNKYKIIDFLNDSVLFTPRDIEKLQSMWTVIEDTPSETVVTTEPEAPTKKATKNTTAKKASATGGKKTTTRKKKTE